ncbi:uncharacterized protein [Miscanthus floridulus]|uniref:uncharacterized protein n=1 Tax=Miscanthus floridulus TaxID=154761 RepID=UPI0034587D9D
MELGLSHENIRQLIVGKEATEEKAKKAIIDLELQSLHQHNNQDKRGAAAQGTRFLEASLAFPLIRLATSDPNPPRLLRPQRRQPSQAGVVSAPAAPPSVRPPDSALGFCLPHPPHQAPPASAPPSLQGCPVPSTALVESCPSAARHAPHRRSHTCYNHEQAAPHCSMRTPRMQPPVRLRRLCDSEIQFATCASHAMPCQDKQRERERASGEGTARDGTQEGTSQRWRAVRFPSVRCSFDDRDLPNGRLAAIRHPATAGLLRPPRPPHSSFASLPPPLRPEPPALSLLPTPQFSSLLRACCSSQPSRPPPRTRQIPFPPLRSTLHSNRSVRDLSFVQIRLD